MRLLITGACGQLGKEWVEFCERKGIEFSAFCSDQLNILDGPAIASIVEEKKPTVLINCAAYTKVDQAEEEHELAHAVNADALEFITQTCFNNGVKLVHYSTDYVFGGKKEDQQVFPEGYPEDFSGAPQNVYGASKRAGEEIIEQSECKSLILRVSWLCGKHGNNFIKTMLRLAKERDSLSIINDQYGSPTFANHVVEQTYLLLENQVEGIFHLTTSGVITWYEFAKEIFQLSGIEVELSAIQSSQYPTKARRPYFSKLSTKKISTIPGISIASWQEGLKEFLNTI